MNKYNQFLLFLTLGQQTDIWEHMLQVSVTGHALEPVLEVEDFFMNVILSSGR